MNPSDKGWLKKYVSFRSENPLNEDYTLLLKSLSANQSVEEFIYVVNQPSGIIYGYPVNFSNVPVPGEDEWNEKDKMKIILLESILHTSIYKYYSQKKYAIDFHDYEKSVKDASLYFVRAYPQLVQKKYAFFGPKDDHFSVLERIIDKRINIRTGWNKNFVSGLFHNSLLFLDIIGFAKWITSDKKEKVTASSEEVRLEILKTIAAAAASNGTIENEERRLYNFFLQSAWLSDIAENEARKYIDESVGLSDLNFHFIDKWIQRKFILELAILTCWSDKELDLQEKKFLEELIPLLNLDIDELENSLLAIESFVIGNWENIYFLSGKGNYRIVSSKLQKRLNLALKRNKRKLRQEIYESKELVELLVKSTREDLSDEEKKKVKDQLVDIIKTIPAFAIFMVPGGSVLLPILLKILPKNILYPSSFQD
ncbi:MAG: hypothetical protein C0594_09080 [Marinilabiliales bacterium]|nr:MAG: hypothetical protein C0594_09080 [Marinilabiliales bacterium]